MKALSKKEQEELEQITMSEFLTSYNENMPERFPRITASLLQKFKDDHPSLFKYGDKWSLNLHRKRIMDWVTILGMNDEKQAL